jgi:excisionase family DNA binding protein
MATLVNPVSPKNETSTYTINQLAELMQCSDRHIHRLKDAGKIPGMIRFGRLVRFSKSVIDNWIANGMQSSGS